MNTYDHANVNVSGEQPKGADGRPPDPSAAEQAASTSASEAQSAVGAVNAPAAPEAPVAAEAASAADAPAASAARAAAGTRPLGDSGQQACPPRPDAPDAAVPGYGGPAYPYGAPVYPPACPPAYPPACPPTYPPTDSGAQDGSAHACPPQPEGYAGPAYPSGYGAPACPNAYAAPAYGPYGDPYAYGPYGPYGPYGYAPYQGYGYAYPAGAYPPVQPPYYAAPAPAPAAAPAKAAEPSKYAPAKHFFKWVAAIIGVFFAVLAIETVATEVILLVIMAWGSEDFIYSIFSFGDGYMWLNLLVQITWLAAMIPWWFHLCKRGIGLVREPKEDEKGIPNAALVALRIVAIIFLGFSLQVLISLILSAILPLFPSVESSYETLVEETGMGSYTIATFISSCIAAPIVEELTFRGITFQFALRAVCPEWKGNLSKDAYGKLQVSTAQFWMANVLQAVTFGVMHLNITQGVYAFVLGLVLGWVYWRTGKLRYSMGLHAAFNTLSYAMDYFFAFFDTMGFPGFLVEYLGSIVLLVAGLFIYYRATKNTALKAKEA